MNNESLDMSSIRAMVMEDFYKNSEQRLVEQKQQISSLEKNLEQYRKYDELGKKIIPELKRALSLRQVGFHFARA